ncbi:CD3337/EF1877 family mobilome membrane protein [Enterococcus sp. AZ109]|uniref:CD3337/EF1877 family mobilome membrane protein n=1 Tax=Enterococcus sp. AZ109 TaxID=2774634 RepID=UPI003F25681A
MKKKKIVKILIGIIGIFFLLAALSISAQATGLIDDTIDTANNYSRYPIDNYQLDYFVDSSWDWLPWNWGDGIGKSVMFGLYSLTNFVWLISIYLSNATGYLVGEAYSLDFISDTTEAIGRNIQTLAGINENGFMATGFYPGLILLLILIMGIYVTYTGLIKRETTRAVGALVSFLTIFVLSTSFIAYSSSYIARINEFSADISNAALDVGSRMTTPSTNATGKSSVDAIRDTLFDIQVKQPWMILQYGDSNLETVGEDRVEELEATSPFQNKGKDRTEIIKTEINELENDNMTITKTVNRLGVTVFIFFFNLLISVFVFILTGIMIFSQLLFIIFALFLPISFLLSMIPSFNHLMKTTIMRLFNVIMMRAGITLVLTVAFSLSSMVYSLTASQPFFIVAFMQIVIFAGIYFKLNDLMGMMALSSADSQGTGSRVMRRPKQTARRAFRKLAIGGLALKGLGSMRNEKKNKPTNNPENKENSENRSNRNSSNQQRSNTRTNTQNQTEQTKQKTGYPIRRYNNDSTSNDQQQKQSNSKNRKGPEATPPKTQRRNNSQPLSEKQRKNQKQSQRRMAKTRNLAAPNRKATPANKVLTDSSNKAVNNNKKSQRVPSDLNQSKTVKRSEPSSVIKRGTQIQSIPRGRAHQRVLKTKQTTTSKGKETKKLSGKGTKRR